MQELTDDQLDGLFRKSAEEFEPPYEPVAWESMKAQLDERDRAAFWKKWIPRGLPVLLLLLMGSVWYIYQQNLPDVVQTNGRLLSATEAKPQTATEPAPLQREDAPDAMPETKRLAGSSGNDTRPQPIEDSGDRTSLKEQPVRKSVERLSLPSTDRPRPTREQALADRYKSYTVNVAEPKALTYSKKAAVGQRIQPKSTMTKTQAVLEEQRLVNEVMSTGRNRIRPRATRAGLGNKKTGSYADAQPLMGRQPVVAVSNNQIDDRSVVTDPVAPAAEVIAPMVLLSISELRARPGKWLKLPNQITREVIEPEPTRPVIVPKAAPQRGLSVRLAVSPDLSAIGLHNFSRPGTSLGALLEYRMSSRWSVQAGVIWSMKIYKADSSEYRGNDSYWSKFSTRPYEVGGQCNMLDIPINVRYDVLLRPRLDTRLQPSRWFVSGGITSYITLKEDYSYEYPPHTYNVPNSWRAPSGSYGFSQLNLSAGYERAVSRRLSWQVEPFMKVPLKGVGFFKVNLLSTGAFLSIRYKL